MIPLKDVVKKISFAEYMTISFVICIGMSFLYKYGFYKALGVDWYASLFTPQYLITSFIYYLIPTIIGVLIGGYLGFCFKEKVSRINFITCMIFTIAIYPIKMFLTEYFIFIGAGFLALMVTSTMFEVYFKEEIEDTAVNNTPKILDVIMGVIPLFLVIFVFIMPYFIGQEEGSKLIKNKNYLNIVVLTDKTIWRIVESSNDKILLLSDKEKNTFKIVEYKDIDKIITK